VHIAAFHLPFIVGSLAMNIHLPFPVVIVCFWLIGKIEEFYFVYRDIIHNDDGICKISLPLIRVLNYTKNKKIECICRLEINCNSQSHM
jgi:hypothetical protein